MAVRRIHQRLGDAGRRLRERAYARVAALGRQGVRPDQEAEAERLICGLTEWEAAEGTPLETVLARLPPGLAQAIRQELGAILAARNAGLDPRPGGR